MNILEKVDLSDLDFIKKLQLDKILSNEKLGDPVAMKEELEYQLPPVVILESEQTSLKIRSSAKASHTTQLFNEPGDQDEDLILGPKEKSQTIFPLDPEHPVLKHTLFFSVTSGAKGSYGPIGFGIDSNASLKTMAYLKHRKDDAVKEALLKDIKNMPFVYFIPHIKKLTPGEALAVTTDARMGLSLSFETQEIMGAGLAALSSYLKPEKGMVLEVEAGASLDVNFGVQGNYELIFTKVSEKTYELRVRSVVNSASRITAKLGITAAFANPKAVSDFLISQMNRILTAITGLRIEALEEIETLLQETSSKNLNIPDLTDAQQEVVNFLVERLDLEDELDKITSLLNTLGNIRAEIQKKIISLTETKIKAGFTYEYSRISSNEVFFKGRIDESILEKAHKHLILFNIKPLVEWAVAPETSKKIAVEKYLRTQNLQVSRNWGVSLGIGDYTVGSKERVELTLKIQETIVNKERLQKVAYDGFRDYDEAGDLGGFGNDYKIGFNVSMDQFKKEPGAGDFNYGFSFIFKHSEKKLAGNEKLRFLRLMDMAKLWNIVPQEEWDTRTETLWKTLIKASDIEFSFQLDFSSEAFDSLKQEWAHLLMHQRDKHLSLLANAFGKAVPYHPDFVYRSDTTLRGKTYGELWKTYFVNEGFSDPIAQESYVYYTQLAQHYFRKKDRDLSRLEGRYIDHLGRPGAGDTIWFGGLVRLNSPAVKVKSFVNGLNDLLGGITRNDPQYDKLIRSAFHQMQQAWGYPFCAKALGIYIMDLARIRGVAHKVPSLLEITYKDVNGKEQVVFLSKKT
ncbi:hypothetical protein [Ascidiimonas aurantiaca]|uniref:hypothetical protein n=1 Tax=Ascidiimonas aurantiaca TaxID=1685432 RepID=UPI0030EF9B56